MSAIGNRVFRQIRRADPAVIARFAGAPSSNVGDVLNRIGCMRAEIKPFNKSRLLGSAYTVRARAGDNLLLNYALDHAQAGDVVLVDAQGSLSHALLGEHMANWAHGRGLAGVVIDGAIRDAEAIAQMSFPVYAAGCHPNGPGKSGPGEINTPISCGGVVIMPGDIVVGDGDGVVVVPRDHAAAIADEVDEKLRLEARTQDEIERRTWGRERYSTSAISALGLQIFDEVYPLDLPIEVRP